MLKSKCQSVTNTVQLCPASTQVARTSSMTSQSFVTPWPKSRNKMWNAVNVFCNVGWVCKEAPVFSLKQQACASIFSARQLLEIREISSKWFSVFGCPSNWRYEPTDGILQLLCGKYCSGGICWFQTHNHAWTQPRNLKANVAVAAVLWAVFNMSA